MARPRLQAAWRRPTRRTLIEEIKIALTVDRRRIYVTGHSNGGFMSYRMACDHADTVAAIASLAGATYLDPTACSPSTTAHTLQIHGTFDTVINYGGGCIVGGGCYPGAIDTAETWATYNACSLTPRATTFAMAPVTRFKGTTTKVSALASGRPSSSFATNGELAMMLALWRERPLFISAAAPLRSTRMLSVDPVPT